MTQVAMPDSLDTDVAFDVSCTQTTTALPPPPSVSHDLVLFLRDLEHYASQVARYFHYLSRASRRDYLLSISATTSV